MNDPIKPFTRWLAIYMVVSLVGFTIAACGQNTTDDTRLTIFAAASLTDVFTEIAAVYMQQTGSSLTLNFAASSTLVTQIMAGAKADLFASANLQQTIRLSQDDLVTGAPVYFAFNRLVLVVPVTNPMNIQSPADLTHDNLKLVLASPGVPVREYTDTILSRLSTEAYFGKNYAQQVYANVVSEEDNVRQVLSKIILAEADAAFVYQTDITGETSGLVRAFKLPPDVQPEIAYPIVILNDARNNEAARQFVEFLTSAQGQCILAKYQFVTTVDDC